MLKNMKARLDAWKTRNNIDNTELAIGALYTTVIVGTLAAGIAAVKQANREAEAQQSWIESELSEGRQVFQMHDGSLISTESARIHW